MVYFMHGVFLPLDWKLNCHFLCLCLHEQITVSSSSRDIKNIVAVFVFFSLCGFKYIKGATCSFWEDIFIRRGGCVFSD